MIRRTDTNPAPEEILAELAAAVTRLRQTFARHHVNVARIELADMHSGSVLRSVAITGSPFVSYDYDFVDDTVAVRLAGIAIAWPVDRLALAAERARADAAESRVTTLRERVWALETALGALLAGVEEYGTEPWERPFAGVARARALATVQTKGGGDD